MKQSTLKSKQKIRLQSSRSRSIKTCCLNGRQNMFWPIAGQDMSLIQCLACMTCQRCFFVLVYLFNLTTFCDALSCLFDTFKLLHERKNNVIGPRRKACQWIYIVHPDIFTKYRCSLWSLHNLFHVSSVLWATGTDPSLCHRTDPALVITRTSQDKFCDGFGFGFSL